MKAEVAISGEGQQEGEEGQGRPQRRAACLKLVTDIYKTVITNPIVMYAN